MNIKNLKFYCDIRDLLRKEEKDPSKIYRALKKILEEKKYGGYYLKLEDYIKKNFEEKSNIPTFETYNRLYNRLDVEDEKRIIYLVQSKIPQSSHELSYGLFF